MTPYLSNADYRELCIGQGWNPDNPLSKQSVGLARDCAIKVKRFMDAKKIYENFGVDDQLDMQIDRWNNNRIEFMLNALAHAEQIHHLGEGADKFFERFI